MCNYKKGKQVCANFAKSLRTQLFCAAPLQHLTTEASNATPMARTIMAKSWQAPTLVDGLVSVEPQCCLRVLRVDMPLTADPGAAS